MADTNRLNKALWTNITRLKLLAKSGETVPFILEKHPFDDEEEEKAAAARNEYVIIGRILPESEIYKESAFRIEMKLTLQYPQEPPEVRFLTPVYHPNVEPNGKFCHHLLTRTSRWKKGTTLVDVIKAVVKHLDEPDADYAVNFEIGKEYMDKRAEFNQKALAMVKKHFLPRE